MKKCSYCGGEYPDDALVCPTDRTPLSDEQAATPVSEESQQEWVTVATCNSIVSADLVTSRLRAADISAFIPDEFLMQSVAFNVNTFGYIRVQVAPEDYAAAKALLSGNDPAAGA